jgi:ABC-type spermidine/putrescine transport system permease subunit I
MVLNLSVSTQSSSLFPVDFWIDYNNHLGINLNPTLVNYQTLISDPFFYNIYFRSIYYTISTTIICFFISYPLALIMNFINSKQMNILILGVIITSFATNMLIKIYSWTILFSRYGFLNKFLSNYFNWQISILNSDFGVVMVMVYCYLPFGFLPIYLSIKKIRRDIVNAAIDLGADYKNCLIKIIWPLSKSGVVSGCTFVALASLGEFVIPDLVGGAKIMTIGKLIWNQFFYARHWPIAAASAIILIIFLIASEWIIKKLINIKVEIKND